MRARLVIRSRQSLLIGDKAARFLAVGSSQHRIVRCTKPLRLILSVRLRVSSGARRRTWIGSNVLTGPSRRGSGRIVPLVIFFISANELILMLIERSSTTRVGRIISGRITPFTSWVESCSSIVGRPLCVGYVACRLMCVSSIFVGELSRSDTRSSTFVIIVRERHAFFSHHSVLFSLEFFIPNFLSTPAWCVSVGAAILAEPCGILSAFWFGSGCREFSSALTQCSCSSERRFFFSCPSEAT